MTDSANQTAEGIVAQEERDARAAIGAILAELGTPPKGPIDLRPAPFAGTWGVASSVCHALAGDLVMAELEAAGKLEGLSKKEAKRLASENTRAKSVELAESVVAKLKNRPELALSKIEAVNGYINIYFDANAVASRLIGEVLGRGTDYGRGAPRTERVMVEHSQPNTHKAFHVGHLRNTCLGVALSNVMIAAGYPVLQASYPGDIGAHVINALWCYENFHHGGEPADPLQRGRWLAAIYAEAGTRLNYRKDVIALLFLLAKEDVTFVAMIDRMLKYLWRLNTNGEDIAYLLGRFTHAQEINPDQLREQNVIAKFWPIVGDQLRDEVANQKPYVPVDGIPEPTTSPEERLERWEELNAHIDWWEPSATWQAEIKATFQRWEQRDPAFIKLWEETRGWSLADFTRIFNELGANIDVWFFESEVEDEGRVIVQELVDKGIAEISDGLTVVKIDEKLGLDVETYRTMPILRSDGTTLYSTKDLALTKRKFEDYAIDRAVWVVDVRQSLYFQQIFKILELWGFEKAKKAHHVGYEIVALPEGVISSRKGNAPFYDDVRDLVLARAREIIDDKNPELTEDVKANVSRQVGLGSLKYAMLARDNNKIVVFDLEEALSFDGRSAPYIQYAHARACRILERGKWTRPATLAGTGAKPLFDFGTVAPEELGLLQQIAAFPDEIQRAAEEYRPLRIASYVYELSKRFNDFYHACPVLDAAEPLRTARLALVDAARTVLAAALGLLGIEAPSAM